jgi:hypothetical protein
MSQKLNKNLNQIWFDPDFKSEIWYILVQQLVVQTYCRTNFVQPILEISLNQIIMTTEINSVQFIFKNLRVDPHLKIT